MANDEEGIFSTSEAAREAGCSEYIARQFAAEHGVKRVGMSYVWSDEDVDALVEEVDEADDEAAEAEASESDPDLDADEDPDSEDEDDDDEDPEVA